MDRIILPMLIIIVCFYMIYCIIPTYYYKFLKTNAIKNLGNTNKIALTFDDGVDEVYTEKLLNLLSKYKVKATFFVVAKSAEKNAHIVDRMLREGHSLGLHSLEHKNALLKGYWYTKKDFKESMDIMNKRGWNIKFYRPPWGHINLFTLKYIKEYNLKLVLWDVMVGDWKKSSSVSDIEMALKLKIKRGSNICLHDGRGSLEAPKRTIGALEKVIPYLKERNFEFVTLDDIYKTNYKHNKSEENKKSFWGSGILLILLMGITFFFLLRGQNISELANTIKNIKPTFVIIGIFAVLLFISCEAINFKIILKTFGEKVQFLQALKYSFIGFYFSSITPSASGGQPMQMYYMKKDNINISYSSLTILIVVVAYQITMVAYGIFAFLLNPKFIIDKANSIWLLLVYGFLINILLIGFILCAIFSDKLLKKVINYIIKVLYKFKIIKDIEKIQAYVDNQIEEYKEGAKIMRKNTKAILKVFVVTIIQTTAMYSVPFWVYKAFGFNDFSAISIISLQAILTIAVASLPLPGSVGASEGGFMMLFRTFFPTGVLTSAMLVSRGISYYIFLIISGLVVLGAHFIVKKEKISVSCT